jgi:hypothetical protein
MCHRRCAVQEEQEKNAPGGFDAVAVPLPMKQEPAEEEKSSN